MLIPHLLHICLYRYFISINRNVDLADILHWKGGVTQNDLKNYLGSVKLQFFFWHLKFSKTYGVKLSLKNTLGLLVFKSYFVR